VNFIKQIKITPKQAAIIAVVLLMLLVVAGIITTYYLSLAVGRIP